MRTMSSGFAKFINALRVFVWMHNNDVLNLCKFAKWGYKQNSVAGVKLIKRLGEQIERLK